jgi:hypothetical protein
MIILTIFKGQDTLENGFLFFLELVLTVAINVDVGFRIKMMGWKVYFAHKWNIIEALISFACLITFILLVFRKYFCPI